MQSPIIVDESGDVQFFPSVEAAERHLEPVDVKNNLFVAYDSKGYLLKLTTVKTYGKLFLFLNGWREDVQVREMSPLEERSTELKLKLVENFTKSGWGDPDSLGAMTLAELVELGCEKYKPFW